MKKPRYDGGKKEAGLMRSKSERPETMGVRHAFELVVHERRDRRRKKKRERMDWMRRLGLEILGKSRKRQQVWEESATNKGKRQRQISTEKPKFKDSGKKVLPITA